MQKAYEIIAAGPAGLAAAINFARAGRRVIVHKARKMARECLASNYKKFD